MLDLPVTSLASLQMEVLPLGIYLLKSHGSIVMPFCLCVRVVKILMVLLNDNLRSAFPV